MKRYEPRQGEYHIEMEEDPEGEWVKWEDVHDEEVSALREHLKGLVHIVHQAHHSGSIEECVKTTCSSVTSYDWWTK
jgi:hypothetical protein